MLTTQYQPHIDGLRAIAVLTVVLFHLDFEWMPGGYIGVDVFFVISGYLITGVIAKSINNNDFSFRNFYIRRIRRLFPALFVTISLCFLMGILFMSPEHLERLSGSTISALLSLSNFYFWQESGYFDTNSSLKPLLHTWSLSVEEQFYLIWPSLIVLALSKLRQTYTIILLIIITFISLYYSEVFSQDYNSAPTAYFLAPFRAYEFSIGALLFFAQAKTPKINPILAGTLSFAAISVIIGCAAMYDKHTIFPGINAFIVCIASAIVIWTGSYSIAGKFLQSRLMISVGLISYSLYLTHWPVIVFYKYIAHRPNLILAEQAGLLISTFFLSWLLYQLVEKKFRRQKNEGHTGRQVKNKSFLTGCLIFTIIIITTSAYTWRQEGISFRTKAPRFDHSIQLAPKGICRDNTGICEPNNQNAHYLIVGDSHSSRSYSFFGPLFLKHKINASYIPERTRCHPYFMPNNQTDKCNKWRNELQSFVLRSNVKHLIFVGRWTNEEEQNRNNSKTPLKDLIAHLRNTADTLQEYEIKLTIFGQPPMHQYHSNYCYQQPSWVKADTRLCDVIKLDYKNTLQRDFNIALAQLAKEHANISFINNFDLLCDAADYCKIGAGAPFYYDNNHMIDLGMRYLLASHGEENIKALLDIKN